MIYNKKDWLNYATEFDYSNEIGKLENFLLKQQMLEEWNIKSFQDFYGFKGFDTAGHLIK